MFHYTIQKRIKYLFLIVSLLFIIIVLRVFYIEVFKSHNLNTLASNLWSRNLPILADRGKITDRNGIILADNITTTSLVIVPSQIKNKEEVATKLAQILNTTYDNIYSHLSKKSAIERVHPEGRGLSY